LLTLNSHPAYESLRSIRAKALAQSGRVSGTELAAGLIRYSERGQAYVDELQAMIRVNGLELDPKGS
jgi:Bax protein